jgi:predicted phosphoribosyltransferase
MAVPLPFRNRDDAARQLAAALAPYRGQDALVLAVPRGAVPMGRVIADALDGELDVVQVRKLGAPFNPELALGAVDERGRVWLTEDGRRLGVARNWLDGVAARALARMRERRAKWTPLRPPVDPAGRLVIVVDDGLATGASMIAALAAVREGRPAHLVCAVPVAPPDTLDVVAPFADDVVCLATPVWFRGVGQFYEDFSQVGDDEVAAVLASAARAPPRRAEIGS